MVSESGVNPTTAQKAHSIIYQLFENAVMDNIIRVNPASNAFRNFRKTAELNPACREPLTVEQQELFIDYIYASENIIGWQTCSQCCLARECGLEKPLA